MHSVDPHTHTHSHNDNRSNSNKGSFFIRIKTNNMLFHISAKLDSNTHTNLHTTAYVPRR